MNVVVKLIDSPSPITAETVALSGVSFSALASDGDNVYVACRDPKNAGKTHLQDVASSSGGGENVGTNVRSAVHEYGGGAFCIQEKTIIYTEFPSYAVYMKKIGEEPQILVEKENCRFADFQLVGSTVYAIMEDHDHSDPSNVKNSVVAISVDTSDVTILAQGHDFYACPRVHSETLAYIAWDHPNMPWDTTKLFVQPLKEGEPQEIAMQARCSMAEPRWDSAGTLYFICDATGWYNIYRYKDGVTECILHMEADFVGASHGWILGQNPYLILKDGSIITSTKQDGLIQIFGESLTPLGAPSTAVSSLCETENGDLYYIGGSTTEPPSVWKYSLQGGKQHEIVLRGIEESVIAPLQPLFAEPKHITFPSADGRVAHGYFYEPRLDNKDVKPPLLVKAHGGPTSQTSTTFRLDIQYWTTRGFAVLDVNYGGSTGYGKEYRQTLQKAWGVVDVQDVCQGALHCVDQGLVNSDWLAIDGSSAGGYTTLAALTFSDVFKAGASLYGISDLVALCGDTHKFESRYMDGLIGSYPEDKAIYDERCPINFTEKLSCPVILLQGDEDKVVPPNQAEMMFKVLKTKGLETTLVIYKGEQHGFRKGENVRHALNSEYSFFCQVFGIEALDVTPVEIGARIEM